MGFKESRTPCRHRRVDNGFEPGEGGRAFLKVHRAAALADADASDAARRHGHVPSPLAGLPVSIKDLFDIAGEPTPAGSVVLADAAPATADAPAVARLRAAGGIVVGRTNMTEFAFSGIGANPHHGTPGNPADRSRIPGGSSSGAAVSVADGLAVVGLGTDTGGSVRIPSAFCGLTGFKPTARRVPLAGCYPLSFSQDSIGPLARSVACCAVVDAILAGEAVEVPPARPPAHFTFGVPRNYVLEGMDATVAAAFERALSALSAAGARLVDVTVPAFDELPAVGAKGGFPAAEAYHAHRELLERAGDRYDPRVVGRIRRGAQMTAADYLQLQADRRRLIEAAARVTRDFAALLMATVPLVAPRLAELEADDDYTRLNLLVLRNCTVGNFLDRCSITLPIQRGDELPVGLLVMGEAMSDRGLLGIAAGIEAALGTAS